VRMALMRRLAILALVFTFAVSAQQAPVPQTPPPPPTVTPDQLWNALVQGNKTFMGGKISFDDLTAERTALKDGQAPPVSVLSCSDSRVPPELVFNQSLGALFVVRGAGNIADDFGLASLEFAILNGWTKLIVVLGHEECGAIKAALGAADPSTPSLLALATRLRMSFAGIPYDSRDAANVRKATDANTRYSAAQLLAASKVIRDAVLTGQVKVVSAYYNFGTGAVSRVD
jgi:carbonic anhydrase